ncbi:hypothetical protein [Xenorhabdus eapokensis]|uniref:Uncharacterized protein n=1 Tax=Xenorhabdus eapokensis TaxID=1873482 RepID=A0A1Q5TMZ1_9GAMM|nr:hypothetical protein [Xenorhabdus eapokensis]OKP01597.1 hypothetical protein Xedl_02871 [Xenorhabdus eapokensis]
MTECSATNQTGSQPLPTSVALSSGRDKRTLLIVIIGYEGIERFSLEYIFV